MADKNTTPIVTLSDADKVFLAATRKDDEVLAYVLALVCNRKPGPRKDLDLTPTKEVYTFESRDATNAFYGAVQQMINMNARLLPNLVEIVSTQIKQFNENVR